MKQILAVFSVIFSLFFLNACDNEKNDAILESKVIRFQVEIPDHELEAGTRVDVNALKFEHGDEIGLFVVERNKENFLYPIQERDNYIDNAKMTYDSYTDTWVVDPPVYYLPKSQDVYAFYAYYPYINDVNPRAMEIRGVLDNQQSRINLGRSDFMTACQTEYVIGSGKPVKLRFTHHFSLVTLNYQIEDSQPLPFVGIRSGQYTVNTFRLDDVVKSDVSALKYTKEKDILIGMSPSKISENSGIATYAYQAIVVPQSLSNSKPLFYTLKDTQLNSININTSGISSVNFKKGEAYIFSVDIY
jgi:hypothetical protein